jgi:hypothetical protein
VSASEILLKDITERDTAQNLQQDTFAFLIKLLLSTVKAKPGVGA